MKLEHNVARSPDRRRDDASNILLLEHVNLQIADQQLATLFYVSGLQLTRDPYLMVGLDNMWINVGRMQFHLPTRSSAPQRLRGVIGLIVPDLDVLENALGAVAPQLGETQFSFRRERRFVDASCPWGNRFRCHAPDNARWARRNKMDLVLSGHVHGGQIRLPPFGSILLPSRCGRRYDGGAYEVGGTTLVYVSRGLSGEHPVRYNCRPEVTLITLRK